MRDTLTHGWSGLVVAWLLVAIPLWVSLHRGKAAIRQWALSPVIALAIIVGAGICVYLL